MPNKPSPPPRWHQEVPGTRWFKADLHLHTLDDPNFKMPLGIQGDRNDPAVRRAFATCFLDSAIEQGIEVLGLTPHAVSLDPGVSAAWDIVDLWKDGVHQASGRSYTELIYAVYPGFEPNFADGLPGIHLIFLFDSMLGKEKYLSAFSALMGGRPAYKNTELNTTKTGLPDAFALLDDPKVVGAGNYIVAAAHPLQNNGLMKRNAAYIRDLAGGRIHGAELTRDTTLAEGLKNGKLRHAHEKGGVALYHVSDAIALAAPGDTPKERELGHRFSLLKLASPSIESLRQAMIAHHSRLRIPYIRDERGQFALGPVPDSCPRGLAARPWLREVTIQGGTPFHRNQTFRFSPDLTCIIGGSMTGKSALLDGLRWKLEGAEGLAAARNVKRGEVEDWAAKKVTSGGALMQLESPSGDRNAPDSERIPMRFFAQGELKSLSADQSGIEHLLFHLVPGAAPSLMAQRDRLLEMDASLRLQSRAFAAIQDKVAEAELAFQRAERASIAIQRVAKAGTDRLPPAQEDLGQAKGFTQEMTKRLAEAQSLQTLLGNTTAPTIQAEEIRSLFAAEPPTGSLVNAVRDHIAGAVLALEQLRDRARAAEAMARRRHMAVVSSVQKALVDAGGNSEDLNAFEAHSRTAQHLESYRAALKTQIEKRRDMVAEFSRLRVERDVLVSEHRAAMAGVCAKAGASRDGGIRVVVEPEGRREVLAVWLTALKRSGITRWFNGGPNESLKASELQSVFEFLKTMEADKALSAARALGMTPTVARTFVEALASWLLQAEFWAIRCPDHYRIQWVEGDTAKDLDELSGGRKLSLLLTLLLDSDDETPLVIDQPEDELDNRFLNETIIPALHRLKGKRQVIFATHNANIVVNGDADRVIALEADAEHGQVYAEGAIEEPAVRAAILKTLDGGEDAFRLRRLKYGF